MAVIEALTLRVLQKTILDQIAVLEGITKNIT
jgi:hypothetical protein